ncbi:pilus assembly protein CpaC [Rhodovulum bhavnagarense]|uniref:Pilus assembly protein CpaC n=1 Tax=Rhodovulum bhavnagarense TaxID=992286 RepID=A0A4R2RNZ6_9RHOB|nr:type II and III secretion system protein family protein [Rhodovulum bhavnagarense]TCP60915.1 pilus assembly protein CpaC [Rhodovulum bhavnagarense]
MTATPISGPVAGRLCVALLAVLSLAWLSFAAMPARAEAPTSLRLSLGDTRVIELDFDVADIIVGSEDVAKAIPLSSRSVSLQTVGPGATRVIIRGMGGAPSRSLAVLVAEDFTQLKAVIEDLYPGSGVTVRNVNGRVLLTGRAADAAQRARMVEIAQAYSAGEVVDGLKVADPRQVMMKVNILELTRSGGKELGINLFRNPAPMDGLNGDPFGVVQGTGGLGEGRIDYLIQALEVKGLGRRLANPTLVTVNGATASFVVGGEIPVVTRDDTDNTVSTDYREYGVRLAFTPEVLDDRRVRIKVTPEVSEVDWNRRVNDNPAFISRKVDTTVELASGESFAIAGLLQSDSIRSVRQFPWLGNVPILGALFRSAAYQNNETELVVVVTPYLVNSDSPQAMQGDPRLQADPVDDVNLFILGSVKVDDAMKERFRTGFGVDGPYGHILPDY